MASDIPVEDLIADVPVGVAHLVSLVNKDKVARSTLLLMETIEGALVSHCGKCGKCERCQSFDFVETCVALGTVLADLSQKNCRLIVQEKKVS